MSEQGITSAPDKNIDEIEKKESEDSSSLNLLNSDDGVSVLFIHFIK